ncbi:uncharacterized protein DSM5745_11360 [Aspergillus mulundensis]|uniref:Transaldolase n=1 Tax=Aspergillus mulundensis TaxID=1810919 RepID=A0A3D8Q7P9_9EURO|nr:Uncharacterized protein DSM5745_11360 [Aspergillus mulundensis]RDW57842.1 Uncharacterized protein DSM5745_11360 [Aspergillus mulundensis]
MKNHQQAKSWLDILQEQLKVDIDCMDPNETRRLLPFKPHDQTSNQRLPYEQMVAPENQELFLETAKELKDKGWEAILEQMSAQLCAKHIANIQGRVLLQTSASYAYDTEKIVTQARSYARELERVGITKNRICIKISCTGPALAASHILLKEGIRTLGTSLFSVAQAIAVSQAECLSISPYYNLPWYHSNPDLWPDVEDPALEHPMTPRIIQIMQTYRRLERETGRAQPMLKPASFKSAREAMAMGELGCDHATIPEDILQQLSLLRADTNPPPGYPYGSAHNGGIPARLAHLADTDPLAGRGWDAKLARADIDYLSDNGVALTETIEQDPVTARGLHEALEAFKANEVQSRVVIEEVLKQV